MIRLYAAFDEVWWAARLNLLWFLGTLAGGVVLGVGPATVAAYTLARRHAQGESFSPWRAFFAAYRREFRRGSLLVLPLAVCFLVTTNVVVLLLLAVITAYLLPMYVHFDLRVRDCLPKASLFAITRPASSVVLLFALLAVAFAVSRLPFLLPTLAVGGWIQLNTWLVLRFFAENEALLLAKGN
ncbi:YesL family protein [Nonomuraea sp. NPDC050556]|uniref:YesL family protein n=1 Tax=Nonomuraea sp. NPDC050556 TaxID=3364369 RepID=UPI00379E45F2